MAAELCPKCSSIQNMRVETSTRQVLDSDGKIKKISTTNYHCEACNSFVRGEEQELVGE